MSTFFFGSVIKINAAVQYIVANVNDGTYSVYTAPPDSYAIVNVNTNSTSYVVYVGGTTAAYGTGTGSQGVNSIYVGAGQTVQVSVNAGVGANDIQVTGVEFQNNA